MKKFAYIFVAIALLSLAGGCAAYAQQMSLGVNAEFGLPMGTFSDISDLGIGGTALFGYQIDPNLTLTGRAGYISFSGKDIDAGSFKLKTSYGIIPILVGARYYFTPEDTYRIYGAAEVGLYMLSVSASTTVMGYSVDVTSSETKFGFAPTVGAQFKVGDNMNLDAHVNYSYISTEGDALTYLGIGVGLEFGL
jgi:opacity protein-like surface antigen